MIKKIVTLYAFVLTTFMAISGILGARNFIELSTALLFSLLSFYFSILMLPKQNKVLKSIKEDNVLDLIPDKITEIKNSDYDPERRKFLKLIGAAGGAIFLTAIFTKKAEASFFGSMPGPGTVAIKNTQGVAIDPAEKKPTDGYSISEIDDSGTDAYYGFVNKDGAWFILKDSNGIYRYAKGSSSFSTNWTDRASLTYDYFNVVF
jgi:hypothetical protein